MRSGIKKFIEYTAFISSVLAISAFFSVKPLEKLSIEIENSFQGKPKDGLSLNVPTDGGCYLFSNSTDFGTIDSLVGLVVFIDMSIISDDVGDFDAEGEPRFRCNIIADNLANHPDEPTDDFFAQSISNILPVDDFDVAAESVTLVLPNKTRFDASVRFCSGRCYQLKGPVRIGQIEAEEGNVAYLIQPIDVYQNSYLTSRYECRQQVEHLGIRWLSWIYCNLF